MRLFAAILVAAVAVFASSPIEVAGTGTQKIGNAVSIPLNKTGSHELLDHWVSQAVSGLMAAVVSRNLHELDEEDRLDLESCSKSARDVPSHAKCVAAALDAVKQARTTIRVKDNAANNIKHKKMKVIPQQTTDDLEWVGSSFGQTREKRQSEYKVVSRDSYTLSHETDASPFATVAKHLTNTVRALKNKEEKETWKEAMIRVKQVAEDAKAEKEHKHRMKERLRDMIANVPDSMADPRKPIALKHIEDNEREVEEKMAVANEMKDEIRVPMKVVREAVRLGMQLAGKDVGNFDNQTIRLASPRFMSIMPDDSISDAQMDLLSPSLFSLHEEGSKAEKAMSFPELFKSLKNKADQEAWLDFVIEASGVTDAINKAQNARKESKEKEMRGPDGTPLYFTKKNVTETMDPVETTKIEVFEKVDKMYSKEQKEEMDKIGYTFLSPQQLAAVYGKKSPYANKHNLRKFMKMRKADDPHAFIEKDIRALATADKFESTRRKDIVGSPFVGVNILHMGHVLSQPVVLSPLVMSPITLSPAVLGPITLSPWVFIPLVLSPRVMGPLILSPMIFSPLILSPLVLHPLILSPGIFNPLVLSPVVLSPLILSPEVFTPLILSPMVLNPLILSPMVGSPLILSPFFLSPLILSPQYLFAVVLSPYGMSPMIESKLNGAEVILSPSWLS